MTGLGHNAFYENWKGERLTVLHSVVPLNPRYQGHSISAGLVISAADFALYRISWSVDAHTTPGCGMWANKARKPKGERRAT